MPRRSRGQAALAHSKAIVDFGLWGLIRSSSTRSSSKGWRGRGDRIQGTFGTAFSLTSQADPLQPPEAEDPDLEAPPTTDAVAPGTRGRGARPAACHPCETRDPVRIPAALETYEDMLASRPPEAEAVAISAAAAIADSYGAHLHIAHLSSAPASLLRRPPCGMVSKAQPGNLSAIPVG